MDHVKSSPPSSSSLPRVEFEVFRVPFFLEPHSPEDVVSVGTNRARLLKKWGPEWTTQKQRHNLKGRGRAAGIPHFNLDRLVGNTMASHRLIQHVTKLYGWHVSEALYDRLNVYYFVDGHSLNDKARLAKVAAQVLEENAQSSSSPPLSEQDLLTFLHSNQGRREIEQALQMLQELDIHSIPQFIIEGSTVVGGAADWKTFVNIFEQIIRNQQPRDGTTTTTPPIGRPLFAKVLGLLPETKKIENA